MNSKSSSGSSLNFPNGETSIPQYGKSTGDPIKLGVFICECGGNISDIVDVKSVVSEVRNWPNVAIVRQHRYLCSKPGVEIIKKAIRDLGLNRLVLACCTPKMHGSKFRRAVMEEGVNYAFLEIANIREQCSWVHQEDPENATLKALSLIKGSIGRVLKAAPLQPKQISAKHSVLVIGGGIAGISASLRLAEQGVKVYLVEKEPSIGGHMIKYPKVFPTLDCSQCILTPKMAEVADNENIELFTLAEVKDISGSPGDFHVEIALKPRGVDPEQCVSCGSCSRVCPIDVPNLFNEGIGVRKAVYIPFPQSVPNAYVVDFENCNKCGKCVEVCPRDAINLKDSAKNIEIDVGAVIVATGFKLGDLKGYGEYYFGKHPNVVTSLQMERLLDVTGPTGGRITRLSDGAPVKSVAYVLCAGSRDSNKGVSHCSRVCCLYAIKQALLLKKYHGVDVWIHFIDIRTPGRRYEEFYRTAQEEGIRFVKGKIGEIIPDGDQLIVKAEDMLINSIIENRHDMVVLCPPVLTSEDSQRLARLLKIPVGEDKFILERHPKLDPLSTRREGIYACGMVLGPKDIQSTVSEAEGAASKAYSFISAGRTVEPNKAYLRKPSLCDLCELCIKVCPNQAIERSPEGIVINEMACNGCGLCVSVCPKKALDLEGLSEEQLKEHIVGVLAVKQEDPIILAFMESEIAYTAADIAGVNRLSYPYNVRVVPLPSCSRLRFEHILLALAYGADGIMMLEAPPEEGPLGAVHEVAEKKAKEFQSKLEDYDIEGLRLWFSKIYVPDWRKLASLFNTFVYTIEDLGSIEESVRAELKSYLEEKL